VGRTACGAGGAHTRRAGERTGPRTTTPIEHLIVVVGENLSFDNLFGIYEPRLGAAVHNLLSEGIANRDGSPGRISPKRRSVAPRCTTYTR